MRSPEEKDRLVIDLILNDEAVMDLECDYRSSTQLAASDQRNGLSRLDLMAQNEHKRDIFSLLQYHVRYVELLAAATLGKNPDAKAKVAASVPLDHMLACILDLDLEPDTADGSAVRRQVGSVF